MEKIIYAFETRRKWRMAERAGFEPAVQYDPYDGLANRSFRPLRHLSESELLSAIQKIYSLFLIFQDYSMKNIPGFFSHTNYQTLFSP